MFSIMTEFPLQEELCSFLHGMDFRSVPLNAYVRKVIAYATFVSMRDDDNNLQGLSITYMNRPERDFAYITYIGLRPEVRGGGRGKELLQATMNLAKERGFANTRLEVNKSNTIALNLYKKSGFISIGESDHTFYMEVAL